MLKRSSRGCSTLSTPRYQENFQFAGKEPQNGNASVPGSSRNDAIYHLNRVRRETMISVSLGVLLLHSGRARGPRLHYRRPSLKLRLVTASDKPSPGKQTNKQTIVSNREQRTRRVRSPSRKLERTVLERVVSSARQRINSSSVYFGTSRFLPSSNTTNTWSIWS